MVAFPIALRKQLIQGYPSFDTVVTVRSDEKGQKILENHPNLPKEKLSYVIVKDVAEEGAFDEVGSLTAAH